MNKTSDELKDFSGKQSELEDEIAMLQKKMLMNGNEAANAKADAEQAQNQAMDTDKVMYFCHIFKKENRCLSHVLHYFLMKSVL